MTDPTADLQPLTWTVHLAARRPWSAMLALLMIAAALALFHLLGANLLLLLIAAVLLVASIAEFLFPVTYRLDADGASARVLFSTRIQPWSRVRRIYFVPGGIKLSPLASPTLLEHYRGVLLRVALSIEGAGDPDEAKGEMKAVFTPSLRDVLEFVRTRLVEASIAVDIPEDTSC